MKEIKIKKISPSILITIGVLMMINPILGGLIIMGAVVLAFKKPELITRYLSGAHGLLPNENSKKKTSEPGLNILENFISELTEAKTQTAIFPSAPVSPAARSQSKLEKRKKYLQIALNSNLSDARGIISRLPASDKILIEVGTPLLKIYGVSAISRIKAMAPSGAYIVADNKCADLAPREVEMMAVYGANAATCLGVAPIETIDSFIAECEKFKIDSMLDMMNVESALAVLKKLKKLPDVVILHRGVDENEFSKEKPIPFYQIKQIKGSYKVLVAVAGGDTPKEIQRAVFNGADIVVVWKNFYQTNANTAELAKSFLQEVK